MLTDAQMRAVANAAPGRAIYRDWNPHPRTKPWKPKEQVKYWIMPSYQALIRTVIERGWGV